ncbi:MAG: NAD(P)H-dependent oxidoreductase subunit E [Candidatus Aminicenantes bacterium]|nr:NAD(P)H-dependent oxidoreductase subunit E [Candidatus Aminicenantes bacterium]NIM81479.1 NAD(P)H-dependent oxidoreductase subunit E [Candidatus Aminicenantes bacterium]NIN20845.1 NAD(P)H-dependent oxidoreductase subunit E [Candidatus Aminicenantes bacterium]NIN44666.1 NAD(P)H-dependent oxidoreductase subunit E [Candidatus Aminicenantes bacterium]NIN87475.1 NAD(P)H-dependent oxidoreductase subunit E [Candidatus Aminicenantes bacterium]
MPVQNNKSPSPEDMETLGNVFERHSQENSLMIYLQQIQAEFGYIPEFAIKYIAERTLFSESRIYGVITFYTQFSLKPVGKNIIKACNGTACHVGGSKVLGRKLKSYLKVDDENPTTEDRLFTVQNVACLGCCALAPAMMVNDRVYGKLNLEKIKEVVETHRRDSIDSKEDE